ncbi:ArsR family transcriptional regulator [Haloterrigena sp. H1]|uniref:winged helix-turn-helix domain-containing protein n=1 Tax=Haloterrigena sp. H1 TaxID=2552943 RepID=UPI00110F2DE5|nr:helix-turn-helix domain-containing protein [Haloterrigena sp. H1]TMT87090.1 ArsR family transcriptional regulator [Haloterrigena sp. H1]
MVLERSSADDTPRFERIIAALDDAGCQRILSVLDGPKTVPEIAAAADLPLSTAYRKLDQLTEAGLVTETVGVRQGSHYTSRYVIDFDRITIGLDDERTFRIAVDRSSDRSLGIWANASREV